MKQERVATSGSQYDILVGHGVLGQIGSYVKELDLGRSVALITDERVDKYYSDSVQSSLQKANFNVIKIVIPGGEAYKTLNGIETVFAELIKAGLDRRAWILALGGGVIGDMAGFVAATYLRGVELVQVPTTIVAQVDSSIGGKTGVNHALGKNLIGAFHQPRLVYIDTETIRTLPRGEIVAGMAEVVKHAIIRDKELFSFLEDRLETVIEMKIKDEQLDWLIARNARIKANIVSSDEKEEGLRAILNYGHTIGHAIEAATDYRRYRHGEAVILGSLVAAHIATNHNVLTQSERIRHDELWQRLGVPGGFCDIDTHKIFLRTRADKKRVDGSLRFILMEEIGKVSIYSDVPDQDVIDAIKYVQKNY